MSEEDPKRPAPPGKDSDLLETDTRPSKETVADSTSIVSRILNKLKRFLWYSIKKAVYAAFLIAVVGLALVGLDTLARLALKQTHFAHLYPEEFAMIKRDLTQPVPHYDYDLTPGICVVPNQPKGNRFEYANNAGFRDPRPISVKKPDNEFRIFLTGGSTAFGLGAGGQAAPVTDYYYIEHRENIAHVLEKILNAEELLPGKKIRVYNTAVWGHTYQHLLFRYITKLRQYKPDLIVSLDGANELHPISVPAKDWDYFRQGQFNSVLREMFAYSGLGLSSYLTLWLKNNTFLMTFLWRGSDPFFALDAGTGAHRGPAPGQDAKESDSGPSSEERSRMLAQNIAVVVRVVEDYHSVLDNDGVPHILALQPLLYLSKKPRQEMETRVESLGEHRQYYDVPADWLYKALIEQITASARKRQYFVADFSDYFDDTHEWVFTDWCHLTAGANYLIAKELANLIKQNFFQKPLAEADRIESKDSFFWNPAVRANIAYAPPADGPEHDPRNMLTTYPGPALYASKDVASGDKLEIVLDLGREFTLSRLRLVWDDDEVPKEWAVEISPDGQTWNPWVRGTDKEVDDFSWWPGYEYYGAVPVQARLLRYRPVNFDKPNIRLRSMSVYR